MEQAQQGIETQILERAAQDPQFREQLKQSPRGTIAQTFGVRVPHTITVEVLEETPSRVYLVLPAAPTQAGQELSAEELEAVAGGWSGVSECATCGEICTRYCTRIQLSVGGPACK